MTGYQALPAHDKRASLPGRVVVVVVVVSDTDESVCAKHLNPACS